MRRVRMRPLEYELKAPPLTLIVRRSTEQQWCYELHSTGPNPVGGIWSDLYYPSAEACIDALEHWVGSLFIMANLLKQKSRIR